MSIISKGNKLMETRVFRGGLFPARVSSSVPFDLVGSLKTYNLCELLNCHKDRLVARSLWRASMRKGASLYSKSPAGVVLVVKNMPASAGEMRLGFDPWVRKILWRRAWHPTPVFFRASQVAQWVKNLSAMQDMWIRFLGQKDPLEEGMATHSKYSCLENPMDRGAWRVTVHGVAKSRTRLKQVSRHAA